MKSRNKYNSEIREELKDLKKEQRDGRPGDRKPRQLKKIVVEKIKKLISKDSGGLGHVFPRKKTKQKLEDEGNLDDLL